MANGEDGHSWLRNVLITNPNPFRSKSNLVPKIAKRVFYPNKNIIKSSLRGMDYSANWVIFLRPGTNNNEYCWIDVFWLKRSNLFQIISQR